MDTPPVRTKRTSLFEPVEPWVLLGPHILGPGGGAKGGTWVDITAKRGDQTVRVQTIDTLADGVTPTAGEAAAANRIRSAYPTDILLLVPKK